MTISEPFIPCWRKNKPKRVRWIPQPFIAILSLFGIFCIHFPLVSGEDSSVPISFSIAHREWHAVSLVAILALVTIVVSVRLLQSDYWPSALVLLAVLGILGYISLSDPLSLEHLFAYLVASSVIGTWLVMISRALEDPLMTWFSYGALFGVGLSFAFMGIGERVLLTCCIGAINLLYYGYFE